MSRKVKRRSRATVQSQRDQLRKKLNKALKITGANPVQPLSLTMKEIENAPRWEQDDTAMYQSDKTGTYIDINDLYALIGRKASK
jgi:hypothetical protein